MQQNTITTDTDVPILSTMSFADEKTWRPSRRWNLNIGMAALPTQMQQLQTSLVSNAASTAIVQGAAQPVQNLRVQRTPISSTLVKVSVSFTPNPNDRYFHGVRIVLAQGSDTPLEVGTGRVSPIVFTVPRAANGSTAFATVSAQSVGSVADSPLNDSPSKALSLR
jgi:hypothetical protein